MALPNKGRALLAILMVVVFYTVDLAVGLGLLKVYYDFYNNDSILVSLLAVFYAFIGMAFIMSVFPIPRVVPRKLGVRLKPHEHPELFARIEAAAKTAGIETPPIVILATDGDLVRGRICGRWGIGGRDFLVIGLPLLYALTVTQFDALLVNECRLMHRRFWTLMVTHQRPMSRLAWNLATLRRPAVIYMNQVFSLLCPVFAADQQAADRFAAEWHGSDAFIAARCQIARLEGIYEDYLDQAISHPENRRDGLTISERLSALLSSPVAVARMDQSLQEILQDFEFPSDAFSRRLSSRIADVRSLPPAKYSDDRSASVLLPGLQSLEPALARYCAKKSLPLGKLRPMEWTDFQRRGRIGIWQALAWRYAHSLEGVKLGDVFRLCQEYVAFARRTRKGGTIQVWRPKPSPSEAQLITTEVLGTALACRLCAIGWFAPSDLLDRTLGFQDQEFDPFAAIEALITKKLSQQEWEDRIDSFGLFRSMSLAAIDFSVQTDTTETDELIY